MSSRASIEIRRVYDVTPADRGWRVLVDRMWPRGVSKGSLRLDEWARDLAPSAALRKWFGHDPARWREFQRRYRGELRRQEVKLAQLAERAAGEGLLLLYSARDAEHNQAIVLRDVLAGRTGGRRHRAA